MKYLLIILIPFYLFAADQTEKKVKTIYDIQGRPTYSMQDSKGNHVIQDSVTVINGRALVELNSAITDDRQDVSFKKSFTYSGTAWVTDSSDTARYWVVPLTGKYCQVRSSNTGDTIIVYFRLEGE